MSIKKIFLIVAGLIFFSNPVFAGMIAFPDPKTLDEFIKKVKYKMSIKDTNDQIARYVSGVIDRRIINVNSPEGWIRELPEYWDTSEGKDYVRTSFGDRIRRWERDRENFGSGRIHDPFEDDDGRDYIHRAKWAWEGQLGACAETASIAYYVLKGAGIPVRIKRKPGHVFAVIGLGDMEDKNDPKDWPDGARVVDGWRGSSYTPAQARRSPWHGSKLDDPTRDYDNPRKYQSWINNKGKGQLRLSAIRADNRKSINGIPVDIVGPEGDRKFVTYVKEQLSIGSYSYHLKPDANSGYKPNSGSINILDREYSKVKVPLDIVGVSIVSPADGAELTDPLVTVAGTVDYEPVTSVSLMINGRAQQVPVSGGKFSLSTKIGVGRTTFFALVGEARSNVVDVKLISNAIVAKGTWKSASGKGGAISFSISPIGGGFSVQGSGRFTKSISVSHGVYKGSIEGGSLSGKLQVTYKGSSTRKGSTSYGTLKGTFSDNTIKGTFNLPKTSRETGERGTFQATLVE